MEKVVRVHYLDNVVVGLDIGEKTNSRDGLNRLRVWNQMTGTIGRGELNQKVAMVGVVEL